jgi:CubicO group peptidase (beta-lactamase class C family)
MHDFATRLQSALGRHRVTGASFAYWDGVATHIAVAGRRNSATGDPVTADTVMHIGSITKVMNAVLLMQLVDERRLALEDPVARHLPELRLRDGEALRRITCAMLVNHTSGIDGEWLPEYGPDQERIVDAIARCADLAQLFSPGEAAAYCNIATVIAGYLTQKMRGESWYTVIKRRIFEPLELRHSLADVLEVPRFRCSVGDLTDPLTGWVIQTTRPFLAPSLAPAGSTVMMSASDVVTFARTMLNGGVGPNGARILSAASATRMATPTARFDCPKDKIGLGWIVTPEGVLTHAGAGPGVSSVLFAEPRSGRAVALLTNMDRGSALRAEMLSPILESWTGTSGPGRRGGRQCAGLGGYQGTYDTNTERIEVFAENGTLFVRSADKFMLYDTSVLMSRMDSVAPRPLTFLGEDEFQAPSTLPGGPDVNLRFVRPDAQGKMGYLAMAHRLYRRTR